MKKIEKTLKQKITNNLENNLQNYNIKYSLNINNKKNKRISKNQYKILESKLVETNLKIKFPFTISINESKHNLNINKEKNLITPSSFHSNNKNFSFNTLILNKNLNNLQNSIILLCTIIDFYTKKRETE